MGNFSVCGLPAGSLLTRRGQWSEVEKKRGRQRERKRDTEIESGGKEKERAAQLPLQSK